MLHSKLSQHVSTGEMFLCHTILYISKTQSSSLCCLILIICLLVFVNLPTAPSVHLSVASSVTVSE